MTTKLLIILGLAAVVAADSRESYEYLAPQLSNEVSAESYEYLPPQRTSEASAESYESSEAKYSFNWATVKFLVDGDSGYVAEVSYEGEASYPDSHESLESESYESAESREYRPPRPQYVYDSNESK
ncbi:uncharacterized protein LOC125032066 [Penaeus chinensis]|uniref:uncharacterized protein LOC125032066 n=1 Tax=Penaeus chinensis TaxID=139456 RepID=UPI001FB7AF1D|nr:uncharacterized protein LOC125032066 [Penaeus chinensis]